MAGSQAWSGVVLGDVGTRVGQRGRAGRTTGGTVPGGWPAIACRVVPIPAAAVVRPLIVPTTAARFLVVRGQPLLALDIEGPPPDGPVLDDGLYRSLLEAGLVVLERFFGTDLPRGARLGWVVEGTEMRLETEAGDRLLRVGRASIDKEWLDAALGLKGTMLLAGHELELDPDDTPGQVAHRLDAAARERRVAAAIVGVGEAEQDDAFSLPLVF